MWLAVELADNTFGEYRDMLNENCPRVTPGKVHRDYLYDTILFCWTMKWIPIRLWTNIRRKPKI